jgi:hypothetical protein
LIRKPGKEDEFGSQETRKVNSESSRNESGSGRMRPGFQSRKVGRKADELGKQENRKGRN